MASLVRLATRRYYDPGYSTNAARAFASGVIRILQENGALTSDQLWLCAVDQDLGIGGKRRMKQLLRWMKQENLVSTELLSPGDPNCVFKLFDGEVQVQDSALALSSNTSQVQDSVSSSREQFEIVIGNGSARRRRTRKRVDDGPRPPMTLHELRFEQYLEMRGRAPLMPIWEI